MHDRVSIVSSKVVLIARWRRISIFVPHLEITIFFFVMSEIYLYSLQLCSLSLYIVGFQ